MDGAPDLGLFPLEIVLLPAERVPLHIFEPRYRQLLADCVLDDREFVIVHAAGGRRAQVGCTAHFTTLVRRFADGRASVVVSGGQPVELIVDTGGHLYRSARAQPLADLPSKPDAGLVSRVTELFHELTGVDELPRRDAPTSYALAGTLELPVDAKQRLLELRDEALRLELLAELLDAARAGASYARVAAERARSNGRVSTS